MASPGVSCERSRRRPVTRPLTETAGREDRRAPQPCSRSRPYSGLESIRHDRLHVLAAIASAIALATKHEVPACSAAASNVSSAELRLVTVAIASDTASRPSRWPLPGRTVVGSRGPRRAWKLRATQADRVVREAFNSPFWPFVLATTPVGQEGLDFQQLLPRRGSRDSPLEPGRPWRPTSLPPRRF